MRRSPLPWIRRDAARRTERAERGTAADEPRRRILEAVAASSRPVHLSELVDDLLVGVERPISRDETAEERRRAYAALRTEYLPPLVEAGVLSFDRVDDTVELTPYGARVARKRAQRR
ncbi:MULTISPECIES: DUF7344 domain-containing protein [Halorussus]|uniref:DUF7344 domain-containing protein n=1 Tax=Halorussus TaxID=1070314 RepID=UPI00209D05CD|nr:hypothetical protein [Halorussus vallis]USZ77970.1 hypothetical protein NGM07_22610 [Halorussus vallis]USZ78003.1 hypothetical protein NGM07_20280 [Halorussus vallis]